MTDDPKIVNNDIGLVKYSSPEWVEVKLPLNATPSQENPTDVTIEVTAASGPWGGDGSTAPHNLIVIDFDNTIHSMVIMHELGHLINMVPIAGGCACPPGFSYANQKHAYSGKGGSGNHCSYKIDKKASTPSIYVDGRCIMFHQLNPKCELKFCPECAALVNAQTLKKFGEI